MDQRLIIYILIGVLGVVLFFLLRRKKKSLPPSLLSKPKQGFTDPIKNLFSGPSKEVREVIPRLEEILLSADVGVAATTWLVDELEGDKSIKTTQEAFRFVRQKIFEALTPFTSFSLPSHKPAVIFFVGVNGVGKTTTIGKIASQFSKQGKKTMVVAADTFRAAANEQLKAWALRSQVDFVGGASGADPASVVFDGIRAAKSRGMDVVLVDTAGRLHTKTGLMEELRKMVRMVPKELGREPDEIFLVLDGTTGQNGLSQAKVFAEAVKLTGVVLTKYDGTSKGGILVSVTRETGLPLRFVGVGEKIDDLRPFDPAFFVDSLFN